MVKSTEQMKGYRELTVAPGRRVRVTPVYDTYWHFAAKRQDLFMRRVKGASAPWTDDPVLRSYRFTNVYRASDRVSQFLIRHVLYEGKQSEEEVFFRALLFKFFNRIETWEELSSRMGPLEWRTYDFSRYARILDSILMRGTSIYSAAYIMPSPHFGHPRKHRNHLKLLEQMMRGGVPNRLTKVKSLGEVFELLLQYTSIGRFLAYQFAIDLNYSQLTSFSEMEFVQPGPGARDGIRKCFQDLGGYSEAEIIRVMAERASREFERLGLTFKTLWGRPLQLIDCQNLFCEVDKYARVRHPEVKGLSGRIRIKQAYKPKADALAQWYPPKWKLKVPTELSGAEREKVRVRRGKGADFRGDRTAPTLWDNVG